MDSLLENFQIFEVDSDWTIYEEQLEMLLIAANVQDSDKVPFLLATIGSAGYQVLRELCSPDLPQSKSFQDLCNFMKNQTVPKGTEAALIVDISAKEVICDQENSTVQDYQVNDFNGHEQVGFRLKEQCSEQVQVSIDSPSDLNHIFEQNKDKMCYFCGSTEQVNWESVCHQCNRKGHVVQCFCQQLSAERFQDQHRPTSTSSSAVSFEGSQGKFCESASEEEQCNNVQIVSSSVSIGHQGKNNFRDQGTLFSRTNEHCNRIKDHFPLNKSVHQSRVIKVMHHCKVSQFNPIYGERKAKWSRRRKRYRNGHASRKSFMSAFSTEQAEHGHPGGNQVVFCQGQVFAVTKKSASGSFKNRNRLGYHKDYGRL